MGVMLSVVQRAWLQCRCVRGNQELVAVVPLNGIGWGSLIATHALRVTHLPYRSWHTGLDGGLSACYEYTLTCGYTVTQLTPHVTSGSYICVERRSVGCFLAPVPLELLSLTDMSDHHAGSRTAFGLPYFVLRCRPPKLAAAIDPVWPCHRCRLIIKLIAVCFFSASAYRLSILPRWVTTRFPSEVKSNFIKWGMCKDRPANLVWRAFCFIWQLLVGNALNRGWFRLAADGVRSSPPGP